MSAISSKKCQQVLIAYLQHFAGLGGLWETEVKAPQPDEAGVGTWLRITKYILICDIADSLVNISLFSEL
jgi:hypothetical protein